MKKTLSKILSGVAVFGAAMSACGLTIVPTFTASIMNDPNGPAMVAAIQVLQTNLSDNLTVQIQFTNDPGVDLGQQLFLLEFPDSLEEQRSGPHRHQCHQPVDEQQG